MPPALCTTTPSQQEVPKHKSQAMLTLERIVDIACAVSPPYFWLLCDGTRHWQDKGALLWIVRMSHSTDLRDPTVILGRIAEFRKCEQAYIKD